MSEDVIFTGTVALLVCVHAYSWLVCICFTSKQNKGKTSLAFRNKLLNLKAF